MTMELDQARHLLLRSGFQPTLGEIEAMQARSWPTAVDQLVEDASARQVALTPAPDWIGEPATPLKQLSSEQRAAQRKRAKQQGRAAGIWWAQEMLVTDAPLTERMTLFWHSHFTSDLRKVRWPPLSYRQNVLLRRQALGNYRQLLHDIARDPAMLLYLDNQQNRKRAPNENFARELLELFTLGEGHYSEQDVREVARAFTGWRMQPPTGTFVFDERQHDDGEKNVLGQRGPLGGDEIIEIILAQPRAASFIVEKLWREFVSPVPDPSAVQRLAAGFRKDWSLARLMTALFNEPAFRAADNYGTLIKSPIELTVGTGRFLQLKLPADLVYGYSARMGQTLFNPPNVRGWPGGEAWITSKSLLERRNFLNFISGDVPAGSLSRSSGGSMDRQAEAQPRQRLRNELRRQVGAFAEAMPLSGVDQVLLPVAAVAPPVDGAKPSERLQSWLLDPVYQLK